MEASTGIAQGQLRSVVERIEKLEEEKASIGDDIKAVYAEAKANGFDTKILRKVIRLRKVDRAEREEEAALVDLYMHALGMALSETVERTGQSDLEVTLQRKSDTREPALT